jgi:septal ring factor EnvC (AmiA/AmiB activator)
VSHLCELCPGICLTTEQKARINFSQGKKNLSQVKKNLSQGKKNLSHVKQNLSQGKKTSVKLRKTSIRIQYTYYQNIHTLQNLHKHKHYKTHTNTHINSLNAELNPICHLLALLGAHPIFHFSRIRVKTYTNTHITKPTQTHTLTL